MTPRTLFPALRPAALWAALALACWAMLLPGVAGWGHAPDGRSSMPAWEAGSAAPVLRLPTPTLVARQSQGGGILLPRGGPAPLPVAAPIVPAQAFRVVRRAPPAPWSLLRRSAPTAWPRGPPTLA